MALHGAHINAKSLRTLPSTDKHRYRSDGISASWRKSVDGPAQMSKYIGDSIIKWSLTCSLTSGPILPWHIHGTVRRKDGVDCAHGAHPGVRHHVCVGAQRETRVCVAEVF